QVKHNQVKHNQVKHNQVKHNQVKHNQVKHNQVKHNHRNHSRVKHNHVKSSLLQHAAMDRCPAPSNARLLHRPPFTQPTARPLTGPPAPPTAGCAVLRTQAIMHAASLHALHLQQHLHRSLP
ncbi:hypothetical protein SVAN01_10220, partial [Stagonosporopsis vannaccii]